VVLPTGQVVGDTDEDPTTMENHRSRPEIAEALAGHTGTSIRYSNTLHRTMIYVAIPLRQNGKVIGVVRSSVPVTAIDQALHSIRVKIIIAGIVIAVVAALLSLMISRRISRPLEQLKKGAQQFARGDLTSKLAVPTTEEIGALAEAMNVMASQLGQRINTITQQRQEQQAILSSMIEGVVAVDLDEQIISINDAASRFFDIDPDNALKRTLHEVIRNPGLLQLVGSILRSHESAQDEIVQGHRPRRYLQASGTLLRGAEGDTIGVVVVLNDVTRIRELEQVRRDFVANVSHELKTPITSIKGFVETLLDGAMSNVADATRFLKIIARHADRLNAIIEDLLTLSHIEQKSPIVFEERNIGELVCDAVQTCEGVAQAQGVRIAASCEDNVRLRIHSRLLEQAIVNLIDNAVKYSQPNNEVQVRAFRDGQRIKIEVEDHGCGIEAEHLPRIFERFYRVDRARSRELGGTGLGLAIVKHIALIHEGEVTVTSKPGVGSTFTIHLPIK
jgi:two-component system phosphate regulon sensor histidine kinase PhoR